MRKFIMFITAVCVLFLIKLRWPNNKSLYATDPVLDGPYWTRVNPIAKCAVAAMRQGYDMFAVQDGGWCASSAIASQTFNKYGTSGACLDDGEGGNMASQVYGIEGKTMDSR